MAMQLIKRGKRVMVFDEPTKNISTIVAAGLFNPVTGRKMTKTWKADVIFPFLIKFYREAERITGQEFLHELPIYRPFLSIEEQNEWMANSADPEYAQFVDNVFIESQYAESVHDSFGGILLKNCGYLDTKVFVSAVKNYLLRQESYIEQSFDFDPDIFPNSGEYFYGNVKARQIIFCNGVEAHTKGPFSWLPFKPLKGEILRVRVKEMPDCIFNRGVYLVPEAEHNTMKAGATYETKNIQAGVTEQGKDELLASLQRLIKFEFEIIDQAWGIRPSTASRRPFLGKHPYLEGVWIFNGLGTKGVSLAPYFSEMLVENMLGRSELYLELNIERYYSLY